MLTENDIKTLIDRFKEVFATREEVVLKEDIADLKSDFSNLQTSVEGYTGKTEDYKQEMGMLSHQVDRHESWIKRIADKVGIKLEHFEKPDQKEQAIL